MIIEITDFQVSPIPPSCVGVFTFVSKSSTFPLYDSTTVAITQVVCDCVIKITANNIFVDINTESVYITTGVAFHVLMLETKKTCSFNPVGELSGNGGHVILVKSTANYVVSVMRFLIKFYLYRLNHMRGIAAVY